ECWYRWSNENTNVNRFYRMVSTDGINWGNKELMFSTNNVAISPTVLYNDGVYYVYYVNHNYDIILMESNELNIGEWENNRIIPFDVNEGEREAGVWHIQVFKENNNLYHLVMGERSGSIYYAHSNDGESFTNGVEIIKPRKNLASWDNNHLYRSSLCKVGNVYRLYYAGNGGSPARWRVGLSEGKSPYTLLGSENKQNNAHKYVDRIKGNTTNFRHIN